MQQSLQMILLRKKGIEMVSHTSGWGDANDDIDQDRDQCMDQLLLTMSKREDRKACVPAGNRDRKLDDDRSDLKM